MEYVLPQTLPEIAKSAPNCDVVASDGVRCEINFDLPAQTDRMPSFPP
jgi:hypothetical protein